MGNKIKNNCIRKFDDAVSPVIAVILMVAITVVLAGVLYAALGGIDLTDERRTSMSATITEKTTYWEIMIVGVSGGTVNLDETKFQLVDSNNIVIYKVDKTDANPPLLNKGLSRVYPIASGSSPVLDNTTGSTITESTRLEDYDHCYIAIIDQNKDDKLSAGDSIWVYKDYNSDGINDIMANYSFEILSGREKVLSKDL